MSFTREELLALGLPDPSAANPEGLAAQEKIRRAIGDILADDESGTHGERFKRESPECQACDDSGMTPGWVPSYRDPDNNGGHQPAEPCDCVAARNRFPEMFRSGEEEKP